MYVRTENMMGNLRWIKISVDEKMMTIFNWIYYFLIIMKWLVGKINLWVHFYSKNGCYYYENILIYLLLVSVIDCHSWKWCYNWRGSLWFSAAPMLKRRCNILSLISFSSTAVTILKTLNKFFIQFTLPFSLFFF